MDRLQREDGCHIIILYGSRARGDATAESDYDVIAFRDQDAPVVRQTGWRDGGLLDVFIYPMSKLDAPEASLLHVRGGQVLLERQGAGQALLAALDAIHAKGPDPLPHGEAEARKVWAWKMLDRAGRNDVEAHYRRHWLLTALLEHHFEGRGTWYPGSKEALKTLKTSRPDLYVLFEAALAPGAPLETLAQLVQAVSGDRPIAAP